MATGSTAGLPAWRSWPRRAAGNTRGSAAIEYVVLVGVVALLALHAFTVFGTDASNTVRQEGADVSKLGF
jgi:Flp pilus assembly pilin Flp